ncbi:hypothetical protein KUCAC02_009190 [Chaenocephalus aceratus]|uniref:Uncharacterized protein n=1 Tax=Chaenocephalus aceratus TaxID=36190 RepID=A0ACB9WUA3_CHAAC|nr:hypothetical protein KUCAC02_009190 [Chaenocephalus aceratus]
MGRRGIVLSVTTSQAWPLLPVVFVLSHPEPRAEGSGPPLGPRQLMEVEVQDWEWSGLTVHPRGPAHFMLFGPLRPGLELNVTQEQCSGRSGTVVRRVPG